MQKYRKCSKSETNALKEQQQHEANGAEKLKKGANGLQEGNLDRIRRHKNSILRSKTTKGNVEIKFYYISNVK